VNYAGSSLTSLDLEHRRDEIEWFLTNILTTSLIVGLSGLYISESFYIDWEV